MDRIETRGLGLTTMAEKSWPPSHAPPPGATPCSTIATCTLVSTQCTMQTTSRRLFSGAQYTR